MAVVPEQAAGQVPKITIMIRQVAETTTPGLNSVELRGSLTASAGLNLDDRLCLALARRLDVAAYTADKAWKDIVSVKPRGAWTTCTRQK